MYISKGSVYVKRGNKYVKCNLMCKDGNYYLAETKVELEKLPGTFTVATLKEVVAKLHDTAMDAKEKVE